MLAKMSNKIINTIFSLAIAGCITLTIVPSVQAKRTQSSIILDAQTGEVLSSSNADERRYPASLTKMMTLKAQLKRLIRLLIAKRNKNLILRKK